MNFQINFPPSTQKKFYLYQYSMFEIALGVKFITVNELSVFLSNHQILGIIIVARKDRS